MTFGKRLAGLRKRHGLTQQQLCGLVNLHVIQRIAKLLRCSSKGCSCVGISAAFIHQTDLVKASSQLFSKGRVPAIVLR